MGETTTQKHRMDISSFLKAGAQAWGKKDYAGVGRQMNALIQIVSALDTANKTCCDLERVSAPPPPRCRSPAPVWSSCASTTALCWWVDRWLGFFCGGCLRGLCGT